MTDLYANSENLDVYLCQVGPDVSCGACCGLYNVADPSQNALEGLLAQRTEWFARVPRTVDGIDAFKERVVRTVSRLRPFSQFHHCPFLGLIGDGGQRVGCLLHPMATDNAGIDWRGLSYYGGFACRTYFCPSTHQLPHRWLKTIRQAMDHWYLHGLIVTEKGLLAAFFEELERRLDRHISETDFSADSGAAKLLRMFAGLKLDWPFRRKNAPGVCNYFFEDGQYKRPALSPKIDEFVRSPFYAIFEELDSDFTSPTEFQDAEERMETLLGRLVNRLNP